MTERYEICKAMSLIYFPFLDEAEEVKTGLEAHTTRELLDFYAEEKEEGRRLESHIARYQPHKTEAWLEKYNIGANFYIGHFYYENLLASTTGRELLVKLLNDKALKQWEIMQELRKLIAEEKEKLCLMPDGYFNIGGKAVKKADYYQQKFDDFVNSKYIHSYTHFLNKHEKSKEEKTHFHSRYKPNQESYLDYILFDFKASKSFLKKKLEAFIPLHERYRHTHITGNTGSGKSVLLAGLIFSVLRTQKASLLKGDKKDRLQAENFVLIDPHGDLSDDIFRMSLKFHQHLDFSTYLLDPFLDNQKTPVINPFEFEGNETELNSYTEELAGVFREILGTDFTLNAQALLTPCIATLIGLKNSSLYDLQAFMNDEENSHLVERGKVTKNFAHKNFFENGFYSQNLDSTKRAIFAKLQVLLNNKTFSNLTTGKSTLDLEEILNGGGNIIVKLNKKKMRETISPFGRFIIAKIQSIALKRADTHEHLRQKTHLFIDEFQNFITPSIMEILTESRKYRLYLTMAHQYMSQIEDIRIRDAILSNTNIKFAGTNGHKTARELSNEFRIDPSEIIELKRGEFMVKVGTKQALKVYNTPLNKAYFASNGDTDKSVKEFLLDCHYAKPTQSKLTFKPEKRKHVADNIIKDKGETVDALQNARKPKFTDF